MMIMGVSMNVIPQCYLPTQPHCQLYPLFLHVIVVEGTGTCCVAVGVQKKLACRLVSLDS